MTLAPTLRVQSVALAAFVQDFGREGRMHEGVPGGGACALEELARANLRLGNRPDAPAIEFFGGLEVVAEQPCVVATSEGRTRLVTGETRAFVPPAGRRLGYLALAGGVDVPRILGGCGTLPIAGLGGYGGRGLRRGDVLFRRVFSEDVSGDEAFSDELPATPRALRAPSDSPPGAERSEARIRLVVGPDSERFSPDALEHLVESPFTVSSRSDRTGIRLVGPTLGRADFDLGCSAPMIVGAIQVPSSGEPIVLGPDHPTTGGYPVIATVLRADIGRLFGLPFGGTCRFVSVSLTDAREAYARFRRGLTQT